MSLEPLDVEWIEYGDTWLSFMEKDLNQPGVIVMIDSTIYLIGHINTEGGCCIEETDDFDLTDIVERFFNFISFGIKDNGTTFVPGNDTLN